MTEYWGSTIHFFLLILYNFKNIGGGGGGTYGAPEGTRKLKSFEWLDCTNNKVPNVSTAQTIKF